MAKTLKKKPAKVARVPKPKLAATNVATDLADVVTVVKNISDSTLTFGFLPPHGKELAAGASVTIVGDLRAQLRTGGRANQRQLVGLQAALDAKYIQLHVDRRRFVYAAVDTGTTLAVGDLVWLDTDDVKPASAFSWTSDLATTQANFANKFLGIAVAAHVANSGAVTNFPVQIAAEVLYVYGCTSESHEVGDTLGLAKASGNALVNQTLVKAVASSSVARAAARDASAATSVVVQFQSAYWGDNAAGQQ